jgi:hypothetical protein
MQAAGLGRLHRGHAHEVRARIALLEHDNAGFERHAALCEELLSTQKNAALTAKCQRLLQDGRRAFGPSTAFGTTPDSEALYSESRVELSLARCRDDAERADVALQILLRQSGAQAGCLYLLTPEGLVCAARHGAVTPASDWLGNIHAYMTEQAEQTDVTITLAEEPRPALRWLDTLGIEYHPVALCHNDNDARSFIGVALLANTADETVVRPAKAAAALSRFYAGLRTGSHSRIGD